MLNIDFKYLEFWTYYSSEGTIDKPLKREYCFSTIFYGKKHQKNNYVLYIYNDGHLKNRDNNCLITKEQLIEHINEINKFHKFEYKLKKIKDGYKLEFTIDAPLMYHKIILSWLRYSYEFPFNVALYELFKVREEKGFKRLTMLNLFNLIGATMHCTKHGTSIHSIGVFYDFKDLISYKDFKKEITKDIKLNPDMQINDILNVVNEDDFDILELPLDKRLNHTDYWEDQEEYKKRLKVYKKNLKTLKNYYK